MSAKARAARLVRAFLRSDDAAIAPLTGLSLVALIAVGGLAFDYSRLVSLDTEMQDAADHAALAAASQLDREDDQCTRATAAASALVGNDTRFATDGGGSLVTIASVVCDDDARRVDVTVTARTVDFALTPVVGLFNATMQATAAASVGSAICKVPPLMMCNPGDEDDPFDPGSYVGKGLKLVAAPKVGAWAPGNFGFLNVGTPAPSQSELNKALAYSSVSFQCFSDEGVDTDPGDGGNAFAKAFNTRFDIYESGLQPNDCYGTGLCPGAPNSTKDLHRDTGSALPKSCGRAPPKEGWDLAEAVNKRYLPTDTGEYEGPTAGVIPDFMGHPRDKCHAVSSGGSCADGRVGDGVWDYALYMQVNHGFTGHADATSPPGAGATRFQIYRWETLSSGNRHVRSVGTGRSHYQTNICSIGAPQPAADRRVGSMAIINCNDHNVHGNSTEVPVEEWVDVFFVEPSVDRDRTSGAELYVEIIGKTVTGGNGLTLAQTVRRDKPHLIE